MSEATPLDQTQVIIDTKCVAELVAVVRVLIDEVRAVINELGMEDESDDDFTDDDMEVVPLPPPKRGPAWFKGTKSGR